MTAADPRGCFPDLLEYHFRWAASRADTGTWICVKGIYEERAPRVSWQRKEGRQGREGNQMSTFSGIWTSQFHLGPWEA